MCLGCIVSFFAFTLTWGGGQLVAWHTNRKRVVALKNMLRAPNASGSP
jgi:hypothetical protein